jgi:hypothetical protein
MTRRNFRDDSVGVFDFASVIDEERRDANVNIDADPDSDADSYFSDAVYDNDNISDNSNYDDIMDDDLSDDTYNLDIDDGSSSDADDDVFKYVYDDADDDEDDDDDDDDKNENIHHQYWEVPYFTPRQVPDEEIPYSEDIFAPMNDFTPPSSFIMQIQLQQLFNRNRASLKMYDDMISIINTYIASPDFSPYSKLQTRTAFLNRVEEVFQTAPFKPTYGSVVLHNNSIATVPVFDMKTMILSILHDSSLMRVENHFPTTCMVQIKCVHRRHYTC